ncbi:hypothetical protein [Morganella morganii]|uniref:Uncharacterized protein n=1 Tax=bacterium 19GA11TI05 TaxID=2920688 RepID=A0AAU6U110_UNCXX|nr:hypothetical protein [Morganella morganii]MBT0381357.1 hypothetical protein [Morganella morganii subsp. morganii]MBT0419806.1 hypothetical protein [Morganella morganii subsp. morganii]MBT0514688.1 hypothetical protein [Morganella morganii subsp. morganii]MCU6353863.1 hypothetical protein [Morganella morganii]MDW7793012.1 hypothetical protein [Morganella morganii]
MANKNKKISDDEIISVLSVIIVPPLYHFTWWQKSATSTETSEYIT